MAEQANFPSSYQHARLDPDCIRILHLQPGESADSVFVEISHERLDKEIKSYNALSWQWGDNKEKRIIRIKNKDDAGSRFHSQIWELEVRSNLLDALRYVRQKNRIVRLWVDAFCIKQDKENNEEKSQQISLMTRIYGMAEEVCVWLGNASEDSATAMKFVRQLVNLEDSNHIAGLERRSFDWSNASDLAALIKLLKRGWFSRRWVVQEIAVARRANVHCGDDYIYWNELADAVALLEKVGRDGTINRILRTLATSNHPAEDIGSFSSLPAYRLVQNSTGMFRGKDKKLNKTWRYTLEELVSFLAAFEASRLHDSIYALLGLASDIGPGTATLEEGVRRAGLTFQLGQPADVIEVNYNTPPLEVFKNFLRYAVQRSKSLDILCRPWAPSSGVDANGQRQEITLPSWITSLSRKPFRPTEQRNMVRFNPDPLVGPATFRHRLYSASGLMTPTFEYVENYGPESTLVRVEGFQLGVIGEIWDSGEFGNVPSSWLRAGGWEKASDLPPGELWRTLVADRNANGDDPDRWYPMVFQSAVKARGIVYGLETRRLIDESTNAMVAELFRRVEAVVWNRRLIRGQGEFMTWLSGGKKGDIEEDEKLLSLSSLYKGALGLAPSSAQRGDHICIIFGCSVPLILRSAGSEQPTQQQQQDLPAVSPSLVEASLMDGSQPGHQRNNSASVVEACSESSEESHKRGERYTLIGECYLDHMMDGEAMTYYTDQDLDARSFILE